MIYVDDIFTWPIENTAPAARLVASRSRGRWCHMWCDPGDEEKLHEIATKIGLRRAWFQNKPGFPHYDLVPSKRAAAIREGAVATTIRAWKESRK